MKKLFTALSLALAITSAQAEFITGNQLYTWLNGDRPVLGSMFIAGVADSNADENHCLGPRVTLKQLTDVVNAALKDHPTVRDQPAAFIVSTVLKVEWPCKASPTMGKQM